MTFLQMTISASLIIVAAAAVRRVFLSKLPKGTFLALWAVALCRLLISVRLPFRYSIYTLFEGTVFDRAAYNGAMNFAGQAPETGLTVLAGNEAFLDGGFGDVYVQPIQEQMGLLQLTPWAVVWLVGIGVVALFFALSYHRVARGLRSAIPVEKNNMIETWLNEAATIRPVRILQSDRITTPVSIGVFRPAVILPFTMDLGDESEMGYVLAHELEHLRHFDTLWKLAAAAAVCLHWFNPCVWVMMVILNRDLELACDERVLKRFGEDDRAPYALSLIRMAEQNRTFTPLYNSYSKHSAEERIRAIMKYKKISGTAAVLAVLLVLVTVSVFATSPVAEATVQQQTNLAENENPGAEEPAVQYGMYEEFGMTYDAQRDHLYYEGQLVRYFEDLYPVRDNGQAGRWHLTEEGVIDIYGLRDFSGITPRPDGSIDPSGELVGLRRAGQIQFASLDVEALLQPQETTAISQGAVDLGSFHAEADALAEQIRSLYPVATTEAVSGNTIESNPFEEYEPYGLVYREEEQRLYYNGKLVRYFEDVLQTGPSSYARYMTSTNVDGDIDLHAVFDENGGLAGVEPYSQAEFDARTEELKELF